MPFKEDVPFTMTTRSRGRANASNPPPSADTTASVQPPVSASVRPSVSASVRPSVSASVRPPAGSLRGPPVVASHRPPVGASSRPSVAVESSDSEESDDSVEKSSSSSEESSSSDESSTPASALAPASAPAVTQLAAPSASAVIQRRPPRVRASSSASLSSQVDELNSSIWFEGDEPRQLPEFAAVASAATATIAAANAAPPVGTRAIKAANKAEEDENAWKHVISDEEVEVPRHCAPYTFHQVKKPIKQRPQSVMYTDAQRLQALALYTYGVPAMNACTTAGIKHPRTVWRLLQKAKDRGFDPESSSVLKIEYVQDAARSGRPIICGPAKEEAILASVQKDRNGREMPAGVLGYEHGVSASTIRRILKKNGFHCVKPTRKSGLTDKMKQDRYEFAKKYENWTIEDWKNVIWTDETSVVMCRRGGVRIWRKADEKYSKTCVRPRWKGFSEFMFWGCFSYDKKGPCHIFKDETVEERKLAKRVISAMNKRLEPIMKAEWELNNAVRRLALNNLGGVKPQWRWDKDHGKIERRTRGGIDWFRYQKQILLPHLVPFALECQKDRPNTLVMEDGAPSHASKMQDQVFMNANVMKLLWCGNSPDLNMIEPCWWWMKRKVGERGIPKTKKDMATAFRRLWYKELTQTRIQHWIERMPRHIQKVIELRGGNEYREGSADVVMTNEHGEVVEVPNKGHVRPYNPEERRLAYTRRKAGVRPGYKDKWVDLRPNISQASHVGVLRQ